VYACDPSLSNRAALSIFREPIAETLNAARRSREFLGEIA
jgi:hypothetical protein